MALRITRAEAVAITEHVADASKVARATAKTRGYVYTDQASISTAPAKVDGLLVGSACGIPVKRSAALADGHNDYYNCAGTIISTD